MLLTGRQPADELLSKLDEQLADMAQVPGLFALYDPADTPACWYLRTIQRTAQAHGIPVYARELAAGTDLPQEKLGGLIILSKTDTKIPLPRHLDVDGTGEGDFAFLYRGKFGGYHRNTPCTAEACVRLLDYYQVPILGKHVVIIGRSLTVGRPLAMLLLDRDATVTICHSKTENLSSICRTADILICASGQQGLVDASFVHEGQTLLNVGGDADEAAVGPVVRNLCPHKGGVGALTAAVLLTHVISPVTD